MGEGHRPGEGRAAFGQSSNQIKMDDYGINHMKNYMRNPNEPVRQQEPSSQAFYNNAHYFGQSISASMNKLNDQEKRDENQFQTSKRGSNVIED